MDKLLTVSAADFGAYPNTDEFMDAPIQKAIDSVFRAGGGEVVVPTGIYRVKGLRIRSNVTLHLMEYAVLLGSRDPDDYFILQHDKVEPVGDDELDESDWVREAGGPRMFHVYGSRWHNAVIRAYKAENIAIIGERGSVIDGNNCFDPGGEEQYRGPHGVSVINCDHVLLRGYTARNTGNWAHDIQNTNNLLVENVTALAGHDGVHITTCEDVIIKGCEFYTGDDCVAGFDNRNVLVEDCILNTACSAFRFGGSNVLIHHCRVFAPPRYMFRGAMSDAEKRNGIMANDAEFARASQRNYMLSLFTYYADGSVKIRHPATNIVIRDCEVDGPQRFLHFNYSGNETWQNNRPLLDIKFENIIAKNIQMPLTAYGDSESPLDISFENIDFSFKEGFEDCDFMHAANFSRIRLKNVRVANARGGCLIKSWSRAGEGLIELAGLKCGIPDENLVRYTDEEFVCQPI